MCKRFDYEINEDSPESFLKDYYLEEAKDNLIYVQKTNSKITKNKINLALFNNIHSREEYERHKRKVTVALNNDALNDLLNQDNLEEVKETLLKYKRLLSSFIDKEKKMNAKKIVVENGKVK